MTGKKNKTRIKGAALLVVLFIVMLITISALGFLSRSDVELATGQNMALRIQMNYLAESGLEHAKGLILNPQDISSEYWTGATGQQLVAGDDYYDIAIIRDDSDPTNRCNYIIDCNSYRMRNSEKIGRSNIRAELRLDPCISLWTGNDMAVWDGVTINGDIYCNGTLINDGIINGDAFTQALSGNITGSQNAVASLSLAWPRVTVADFTSNYATQTISSGSISNQTFGPYSPVRVCYHTGNLTLAGNVQIEGMLVVDGNLIIQGTTNTITAAKNLPALLVTGNLIFKGNSALDVSGLMVVDGNMQVSADAVSMSVLGGLFINGSIIETTVDSSGNNNTGTLYNGPTWQPLAGHTNGTLEFNGNNSAVEISTSGMNPLQGTISLWAHANNFNGPPNHFLFGHFYDTGTSRNRIYLYTQDDDVNRELRLALGDSHINPNIQNLDTYRWYHIAITWDGTDYVVYLDSIPMATGVYTGLSELAPVADIGSNAFTPNRFDSFNGFIDDVRIYNRELDANDIVLDANDIGLPGLIGHWKLDDTGSNLTVTAAPSKTAIVVWSAAAIEEKWKQAAGAFFKSIQRK